MKGVCTSDRDGYIVLLVFIWTVTAYVMDMVQKYFNVTKMYHCFISGYHHPDCVSLIRKYVMNTGLSSDCKLATCAHVMVILCPVVIFFYLVK